MSGHSKWSVIKRSKGLLDAKRGKIFTRHAKNIEVAARLGGGDPAMNATLATAIDNAKSDNLPKDNIERAIKKGTGALAGEAMEERVYEGYAPHGVALMITALTDNNNRTVGNVRHLLSKHGGKLGENGSVAFQFEKKGIITIEDSGEELEMKAIEAGVEDLESSEGFTIAKTNPKDLMSVKNKLVAAGVKVKSAELAFEAKSEVKLESKEEVQKVLDLIELLEEDDDIDSIASNLDFDEALLG
ncbi:MAG: YebC/PmpR family DNA-binding transcriptional regulator [Candidatus Gracilibacteria bacterium]|nr:YebC/PmpR family DNA-binding transcriptional regulator [Candidatus Gracilibacteria bacterium]MDD5178931.1 YebC/PmpR family DNA-binding transcriptional regulator [Candidatus Gracilibacteria bacterium]